MSQADQQAQPVGWAIYDELDYRLCACFTTTERDQYAAMGYHCQPLFTSPPAQPHARELNEEEIEAAFWRFDARHKGYGEWKLHPMSERDAFKRELRAVIAADRAIRPAEGMVMVPVEPTEEMVEAYLVAQRQYCFDADKRGAVEYAKRACAAGVKAMIAASQKEGK